MQRKIIYRLTSLLIGISMLFGTNLVAQASSQFVPARSAQVPFAPVADAYVLQTSPSTNYGSNVSLRVDGSPVTTSYLRFDVNGFNSALIQSALLRIYANSANASGFSVQAVADNTWAEDQINYGNAPAPGNTINTSNPFGAGTWVEVDLSSYIKAEGTYSLAITTQAATYTNLASREDPNHAPQLVVSTSGQTVPDPTPTNIASTPDLAVTGGNILLLAGDICKHNKGSTDYTANCKKTGDLVRSVLAAHPGTRVQTLGDNVNNDAGAYAYDSQYRDLYAPNWGSFLSVTHTVEGNHDTYPPGGTAPYFAYFGAAAGPKPGGYYSYNLNKNWHVIVLNAECSQAGGCGVSSAQTTWLQKDLVANTRQCVIAVWHQPRFTSGRHPNDSTYAAWWNLLYQYKVDIVANGHNHNYERFDQINSSENAAADGIREFIVGTGGAP